MFAHSDDVYVPDIALRPHGMVRWASFGIFLIYTASFVLPATNDKTEGWAMFLMGFFFTVTVIGLLWSYPWLANLFLWVGLYALGRGQYKRAFFCGIAATLLAGAFIVFPGSLRECRIGYWLWLASMASLAIVSGALLAIRGRPGRLRATVPLISEPFEAWGVAPPRHTTINRNDRFTARATHAPASTDCWR